MPAGITFAKELNQDFDSVKTPAKYIPELDEWLMLSGNHLFNGTLWVPQKGSADGKSLVEVSGRNVEQIIVHNALAITNTSYNSANIDLSKYKSFEVYAVSTLNQDVEVGFQLLGVDAMQRNYAVWTGSAFSTEGTGKGAIIVAGSSAAFKITSKLNHFKGEGLSDLRIFAKCTTAPTTGSITIWIEGVIN